MMGFKLFAQLEIGYRKNLAKLEMVRNENTGKQAKGQRYVKKK